MELPHILQMHWTETNGQWLRGLNSQTTSPTGTDPREVLHTVAGEFAKMSTSVPRNFRYKVV